MKKVLNILLLIMAIALSCKKSVVNGTFTIKGHLYINCNSTPVSNYPLTLTNHYFDNNEPKYEVIAKCTTDAKGYFEFTYNNPVGGGDIYINEAGTPYPGYINYLPIQNIDSLVVLGNPVANIKSKLIVTNSYTSKDTLFVTAIGGTYTNYPIVGPFVSGQLLPSYAFDEFSELKYYDNKQKANIFYRIGSNSTWQTSSIYVTPCSDTTITVEIK